MELSKDGTEDITIPMGLLQILGDNGYPGGIEAALGRNPEVMDLLFVTQRIQGQFLNRGSAGEEVVQDDLKGIMTPGDKEQKTRELLLRLFG